MPDILKFECRNWTLTLWTRDNQSLRRQLSSVLKARGKKLPSEELIYLSFPLSSDARIQYEDQEVEMAEGAASFTLPSPLCYENRDYEFEIQYKAGFQPNTEKPVIHRLREIEEGFRIVKGKGVRGIVNFRNNIGWFKLSLHYHKEGREYRDSLSFRVFPTKMDMESDLSFICGVIDMTYPLWRFSLAQKTDSEMARTRKPHESFELLWLYQFKALAEDLSKAVQLICRSPHSRLLPYTRKLKAEKITGRICGRREEQIAENLAQKQYDKRYCIEKRRLSYDTPENRFVKMVLSYSVRRLKKFFARANELKKLPEQERLSESFYDELKEMMKPFEQLSKEALFGEILDYDGRMRESLVLHHRAGYARVYRIWQDLKLYLDFFGNDASVAVRSVEELYEIWCLLEVRNQLMKLGFEEESKASRKTGVYGFEKKLNMTDGTFRLKRSDGMTALLIHEPKYSSGGGKKADRIYSWTTSQKPDIFLEIVMPSSEKFRWIFDAKYRIDSNENQTWPMKGIDTVPDDAINQMHRYRDSLIYLSKAQEDREMEKSRPVVGAFALYPGWFEDQETMQNPYQDSIAAVGIGAFPLLPGKENRWLADFLQSRLGPESEAGYQIGTGDELFLQESLRIAPSGMKQYRYSDLILAVDISQSKDDDYIQKFREGRAEWYHIPDKTVLKYSKPTRNLIREIKYCAFSVKEEKGRVCRYVYPVVKASLELRRHLDAYAGGPGRNSGDEPYWLFSLGKPFLSRIALTSSKHSRHFQFRVVSLKDFLSVESWDDIPAKYQRSLN